MAVNDDTLQLLSQWDDALDPGAPLDLGEAEGRRRYIPIDRWVDPAGTEHHLRGGEDIVEQLCRQVRLSSLRSGASTQLLAGFRGTGKSTELRRLATDLSRLTFAVFTFDAHDYLSLNTAPSAEQLGLAIAGALGEHAERELKLKAFERRGIWARIRDFLNQDVDELELSLPVAGAQLKTMLRETPDFADKLARLLANKPDVLRGFVHGLVEEIAQQLDGQQLVLLVDGLDKFVVPRDEVVAVYRAMADLFFHQANLLCLPRCHVVYVIPPYLGFLHKGLAEAYGGRLRILPSVKVRERPSQGGQEHVPGLRCLESIVAQRVDLDRLFGSERRTALDRLGLASGGHVRDLFNLLREVLRNAMSEGLPVSLKSVERAKDALSQDRAVLFRPTVELLDAIRSSEDLSTLREDQLAALSAAMDEYMVLSYRNGDAWYGVHPLIEPALNKGLQALARLEAAQERGTR